MVANQVQFEIIYEWKHVDFEWKDKSHKGAAIASGDYNYTKPVMVDIDYSRGVTPNIIILELFTFAFFYYFEVCYDESVSV